MPSVIHHRHSPAYNARPCYACTITLDNSSWGKQHTRFMQAVQDYETAVEWIESTTAPFSISDVFRNAFNYRGPTPFRAAQNAVHDMAGHNLIHCIKKRTDGKCSLWQLTQTDT